MKNLIFLFIKTVHLRKYHFILVPRIRILLIHPHLFIYFQEYTLFNLVFYLNFKFHYSSFYFFTIKECYTFLINYFFYSIFIIIQVFIFPFNMHATIINLDLSFHFLRHINYCYLSFVFLHPILKLFYQDYLLNLNFKFLHYDLQISLI